MAVLYVYLDNKIGSYLSENHLVGNFKEELQDNMDQIAVRIGTVLSLPEEISDKNALIITHFYEANPLSFISDLKMRFGQTVERFLVQNGYNGNFAGISTEVRCDNNFRLDESQKPKRQTADKSEGEGGGDEYDYRNLAKRFEATEPLFDFDMCILNQEVLDRLDEAISIINYRQLMFDQWGLKKINPHPASIINFFGPTGTGKTMTAHAIANKLGKKIMCASYADIESKYHGEGPKMLKAIFLAASRDDAVLFLDESDSLLSARLTNVTQGSEQAINSMRSQLLLCLQEFEGVVIFATNLIKNYDKAFLSRIISVEIGNPDADARQRVWDKHMRGEGLNVPWADDVTEKAMREIAEKYEFNGREIRNAVIYACTRACLNGGAENVNNIKVTIDDICSSCDKIVTEKEKLKAASKDGVRVREVEDSEDTAKQIADTLLGKNKNAEGAAAEVSDVQTDAADGAANKNAEGEAAEVAEMQSDAGDGAANKNAESEAAEGAAVQSDSADGAAVEDKSASDNAASEDDGAKSVIKLDK